MRHNIPEISAWGPLHIHSETEWKPVRVDGVTIYPSAEEAEYSASISGFFDCHFSFMVWAARLGHSPQPVGQDRRQGCLVAQSPCLLTIPANMSASHGPRPCRSCRSCHQVFVIHCTYLGSHSSRGTSCTGVNGEVHFVRLRRWLWCPCPTSMVWQSAFLQEVRHPAPGGLLLLPPGGSERA